MNGHLFYGLQDDSRRVYREYTPGFSNDAMKGVEREVQVVGVLDNRSILKEAFSHALVLFMVV